MVTGRRSEPPAYFDSEHGQFQVILTANEMEILHNALQEYTDHELELVGEAASIDLSRATVIEAMGGIPSITDQETKIPIDDLFIGTYIDAAKLRADLVQIVGYDMSEEGV